eukprot:CAMPEP_0182882932 /NCGR_PEP_ID=MMETSP0034_2-20130328/18084_1 /TAXON_ID=156128 /ORGANISM="Nephroselmis pyriformis, Strain CCMP717" /LENGTH=380 /DNA_ID=CAMNT_0025016051 /DNA_START=35 /DNA_END=1174 /DNA_ORIENTATION=+
MADASAASVDDALVNEVELLNLEGKVKRTPHGQTQEDFDEWVNEEVAKWPVTEQYPDLAGRVAGVICGLRKRLFAQGETNTWIRLIKGGRMLKEFSESLPVVTRVLDYVERVELGEGEQVTIIDLCSGVGYMSILLAELLAGSPKVARFVLIDYQFPLLNTPTQPHHINPEHLNKDLFPFELTHRKYDLKSSSVLRQIQKHIISRSNGPLVVLGIHLCSILSIRAVQFYNDNPRCTMLALKPCCLPPWILAQQKYVWTFGGQELAAKDVAGEGKYNKGKWKGPRKETLAPRFKTWAEGLFAGIDVREGAEEGEAGAKTLEDIKIVHEASNYQTLFAFAERPFKDEDGVVSDIGGEPLIKPKKKRPSNWNFKKEAERREKK